jgi:DNA-binding transcriptional MerR regulator
MPAMNKYKTVKEVCALTGLTRKHLYYFHHEKVVRAVAYANYSVEGYDGYKLYDDAAIEKLQQIALYYQLGLKRDEIRDIMLMPDYDSNRILESMLDVEREKKVHIERNIAALEFLILTGTKNGVSGSLKGMSLDALGRTILTLQGIQGEKHALPSECSIHMDAFVKEFQSLVSALAHIDPSNLELPVGEEIIKEILDLCTVHFGADSTAFVLGVFLSILGQGSITQGIHETIGPSHARAVIQYIIDHSETCTSASGKVPAERTGNK